MIKRFRKREKKMDKILKDETRIILIDDNKKYIDNKKTQ